MPLRNARVAWFCIAVFDGAEAEKAGDKGIPSASVTAIAIETCFVDVNILSSIFKVVRLASTRRDRNPIDASAVAAAPGVARAQARKDQTC